jgi:hypothetical protein
MDNSVSSIDMLARLFNYSLRKRGFTRSIHREMTSGQSTGLLQHNFGLLALVVSGEVEVLQAENQQIYSTGEEFMIPANTYFQVIAGCHGVRVLLAKKRTYFLHMNEIEATV